MCFRSSEFWKLTFSLTIGVALASQYRKVSQKRSHPILRKEGILLSS